LKAPGQGPVLFEAFPVLVIGGGADALHLPGGQHGLEDVRGIHRPPGGGAGADDGMDLVDEQDDVLDLLEFGNHLFQPFLEVPAEPGPRDEGAHVQGIDLGAFQGFGNLVLGDQLGQALGNGRLAHPRFPDVDGVVLGAAAEDLHGPLEDVIPADEGIQLPRPGLLHQLRREGGQNLVLLQARRGLLVPLPRPGLFPGGRRNAVGNVIQQIQACDALAVEEKGGIGFPLVEDGDKDVADIEFALLGRGGVPDRPFDDVLKTGALGRVGFPLEFRQLGGEKVLQTVLKTLHIPTTGPDDLAGRFIEQGRE